MGEIRDIVRAKILAQKESFCITDIYLKLKDVTTDQKLILDVVDELYSKELLTYDCIDPANGLYAFMVK